MKILFAADTSFHYMGDNYPGDEIALSLLAEAKPCFDQADFSVINLESPIGHREECTPIPKSGPNIMIFTPFKKCLEALSPSAVCLANNHTGDFGDPPIFDTLKIIREMGAEPFGAGANIEEAYESAKFEKDGERIALIGVCENEFGGATEKTAGSAGYSLGRLTRAIRASVEEGYKPIIFFHGGNEHYAFPAPSKKELYRHFVDLGASAVIAMHTHCPQGYEFYRGAPIVYSMGNFYFPAPAGKQHFPVWEYGYMTQLSFADGSISLEAIPYRQTIDGLSLLKGEELAHFEKYMKAITAPIEDDELLGKYFDAWCFGRDTLTAYPICYERKEKAVVKNLLGCEAHNEVLKNEARLWFEGKRKEDYQDLLGDIAELQKMKIPQSLSK